MMHIAVVGSGAVGGYYGARLAHAGERVTFIARGAHLRAIRARGLLVWSPLGDLLVRADATGDAAAVGPVDLVLFAVKSYDTEGALPLVAPLVGTDTIVLPLQNGVDAPERVAAVVGRERVLGGATYIATVLRAPGLIVQTGTHRRIALGEVFEPAPAVSPRVARVAAVLAKADIEAQPAADARVPMWEKLAMLAPIAGFAAAARLPAGAVWQDEFSREQYFGAVREVARVARASGVPVADDLIARTDQYTRSIPPTMRPSMLADLVAGRRIEVEALQGAVVRRGRALGVPTPILDTLYGILKLHEGGGRA